MFENRCPCRQPATWRIAAGPLAVLLLVAVGCDQGDSIRSYTVKRRDSALPTASVPTRMLAAIVTRGEEAWFFKMTGPDATVGVQLPAFTALLETLQFGSGPGGEPQWKLPAGWQQKPGNSMRFATLVVSGSPDSTAEPVECSVSKLPFSDQSRDDYILANVNRWRGQLNLGPISAGDLSGETTSIPLADKTLQATVINIIGHSAGAPSAAPFAGGASGPMAGPPMTGAPITGPPGSQRTATESGKLKFQAPAAWSPGELEISRGGIVVRRDAAFEVREGEQRIEITITKLPTAPGATLPNVNRWRGQIGLGPLSPEQFSRDKQPQDVGGIAGDYLEFTGAEQSILGVIAERDGMAWFIKLQGSKELAVRERTNFQEFVRSIRWE